VLAVTDSLDSGREDVGGGGSLLRLWAENSSCPWMVRNSVIDKIKSAAMKMVSKKRKGRGILTCACSRSFSGQWRRGRWQRRLAIVSVGQEFQSPVDGA
jgi:hypothetical protein